MQKSIEYKPRSQPEARDEAVQGGVAVVGRPGVSEIQEAFLLLAGEILSQPILVLADRSQLMLDAHVSLESAVLRADIAVIQLLNKAFYFVSPSLF